VKTLFSFSGGVGLALVLLALGGHAEEPADTFARIIEVIPPAALVEKGSPSASALDKTSEGMALSGGETISTGAGGRVRLFVDGSARTVEPLQSYTLPLVELVRQERITKALDHFFRAASSARGASSDGIQPSDGSSVRPQTFQIRWDKERLRGTISLAIEDQQGRTIWKTEVSAAPGFLDDPKARAALASLQADSDSSLCRLRLTGKSGAFHSVDFWILSKADEKKVREDLAAWDLAIPDRNWMWFTGYASVFVAHDLLTEAIPPSERALALSPNANLRAAVAGLYRRAGEGKAADRVEPKSN